VATGYTANHVCDILHWGRGRVARIEANLWKVPEWDEVQGLLRLYGVSGINREEAEELTLLAGTKGWWHDFPEIFDSEFPGYENDAVTIRTSSPLILPELVQTPAYIESTLRSESRPPAWRRKTLAARLHRQEIIVRPRPVALSALITEASLRFRWGTLNERREQIEHLINMSELSNVHLRIQRFDDGCPAGASSMVSIFGFDSGSGGIVFVETGHSIEEVRSQELAEYYEQSFQSACEGSLDPDDTLRYLKRLAKESHFGSQRIILAPSRYLQTRDSYTEHVHAGDVKNEDELEREGSFNSETSVNTRISVVVYVDGNRYAMRRVIDSVDELVQALGYGDPFDEELEQGSIFRKYFASIQRGLSSSEVQERALKAERALELLTIDSKQAQIDGQTAAAVQNLVDSLREVPTACVRVGSILLIKYTRIDGVVVFVRSLSQVEIRIFEQFPEIQRKPEKALEALAFALAQDGTSPTPNWDNLHLQGNGLRELCFGSARRGSRDGALPRSR
jgi:Domain of unknown function (DUF5753)